VGWYLAKLTLLPGEGSYRSMSVTVSRKYEKGENDQQNRRNRKEERRREN
jgi:hypothetical protein